MLHLVPKTLSKTKIIYHIKDLSSYVKPNIVSPLCLNIDKLNWCIEENIGDRYLTLVATDEIKDTQKMYKELWDRTKNIIKLITNNSDICEEKYMKIKFNSNDYLSLKKPLELCNMVINVRSVFHEDNKYYPQVLIDKCLYKL